MFQGFTKTAFEFLRYILVGGGAFVIDFAVLYISRTRLFYKFETGGVLLATALGFTVGLVFNYTLSIIFVFKDTNKTAKQHKIRSFIIFVIIGIAGLGITELCMLAGVTFLGINFYLIVKIITAGIVLIWNFTARKFLIFNNGDKKHVPNQ